MIRPRLLVQILLLALPAAEMAGQGVTSSVLNVFRYGQGKTKIGDLKDDVMNLLSDARESGWICAD